MTGTEKVWLLLSSAEVFYSKQKLLLTLQWWWRESRLCCSSASQGNFVKVRRHTNMLNWFRNLCVYCSNTHLNSVLIWGGCSLFFKQSKPSWNTVIRLKVLTVFVLFSLLLPWNVLSRLFNQLIWKMPFPPTVQLSPLGTWSLSLVLRHSGNFHLSSAPQYLFEEDRLWCHEGIHLVSTDA